MSCSTRPSRPLTVAPIVTAIALPLLAACGDDTQPAAPTPDNVAGQYVLVEAMGQEPPAVVSGGAHCNLPLGYNGTSRYTLLAGILQLSASGNWTLAEQLERRCVPPIEGVDTIIETYMLRHWGTFTVDGNAIELAGQRADGRCILDGPLLYLFLDVWYNDHYFTYERAAAEM